MSEALSSINFLFLTSLGVSSWVILCYFKEIEGRRKELVPVYRRMEEQILQEDKPTVAQACSPNYDILFNFVYIFACIYALAKVTSFTENYISRCVQNKFASNSGGRMADCIEAAARVAHDYQIKVQNMLLKIVQLEKNNTLLEDRLKSLQMDSRFKPWLGKVDNGDRGGSGVEEDNLGDLELGTQSSQNIFISNRHFHMKNQVFVNEGNMKLDINAPSQVGGYMQTWQKYLEMQQIAACMKTPVSELYSPHVMKPVVMSVEDVYQL